VAEQSSDQKINIPEGAKPVPPKKSNSNNKTLIIVLSVVAILVILPVLVFGAGVFWLSRGDNAEKLTENIIESSTGANIDINTEDQSVNIQTDDGSFSAGSSQELPADFPSVAVVYDNQKIVGVVTNNQDTTKVWSVSAETSDNAEQVNNYLVSKSSENGWTTTSTSTINGYTSYSLEKDNLQAQITVFPQEDGKVSITYYVSQEL
jgi:hypothetical protein